MKIGRLNIKASRWPWQVMARVPVRDELLGDVVNEYWREVKFGWRPHKSGVRGAILNPTSARFGGGWNYKLGIEIGCSTVMLHLLFGSVSFWVRKEVKARDVGPGSSQDVSVKSLVHRLWSQSELLIDRALKSPRSFTGLVHHEVMSDEQFDALANAQPTAEHERRAEELMKRPRERDTKAFSELVDGLAGWPNWSGMMHEDSKSPLALSYEAGRLLFQKGVAYEDLGDYTSSDHSVGHLQTGWMAAKNRQEPMTGQVPSVAPAPQSKEKE